MKLGAFSISLTVQDISASKSFYEKFGFEVFAGELAKKYFIMKNGDTLIGLFEGMFDKNFLTFNPGWDQSAQPLDQFDDVRELQTLLKTKDIALDKETATDTEGPASIVLTDPDGNQILIDQHR